MIEKIRKSESEVRRKKLSKLTFRLARLLQLSIWVIPIKYTRGASKRCWLSRRTWHDDLLGRVNSGVTASRVLQLLEYSRKKSIYLDMQEQTYPKACDLTRERERESERDRVKRQNCLHSVLGLLNALTYFRPTSEGVCTYDKILPFGLLIHSTFLMSLRRSNVTFEKALPWRRHYSNLSLMVFPMHFDLRILIAWREFLRFFSKSAIGEPRNFARNLYFTTSIHVFFPI